MNKQQVEDFVAVNHPFMTVSEMAAELNLTTNQVNAVCLKNGYKAITIAERAKEYILKHPDQSIPEATEKLGVSRGYLKKLFEEMGWPYPTRMSINKPISTFFDPNAQRKRLEAQKALKWTDSRNPLTEFEHKYGACMSFTDLVYPKEKSWIV